MYGFTTPSLWTVPPGKELTSVTFAVNMFTLQFDSRLKIDVLSDVIVSFPGRAETSVKAGSPDMRMLLELVGDSVLDVLVQGESLLTFVMGGGGQIIFEDSPDYESYVFDVEGEEIYV
ncbi:hypothetical protein SAMN06295879_2062 [Agreia bicolorata]|uniref:Uncharacterized protein n=1 Tax=Agreia bicolorata TaxID=110935 RepID=A0A1T4Y1M1_9MICO|nr:hypothetical protein [Agreia bicolorata]SKA95689.1 hypothetical protein SAMN06295879_2062 [Agreia bicolorata]